MGKFLVAEIPKKTILDIFLLNKKCINKISLIFKNQAKFFWTSPTFSIFMFNMFNKR